MKKYAIFLLLALLAAGLASCKQVRSLFADPPSKSIVLLFDDTDSLESKPKGSEVASLFAFSNADIYHGYNLRIRRLSAINLTQVYENSVQPQNSLSGSEMKRTAAIKAFRKSTIDQVDELSNQPLPHQSNSVLYRTIAQELNRLADDTSKTRICLIYSNMEENSQDADFVSLRGFLSVAVNREEIADKLEQIVPMKDLSGIEVRIIFKPTTLAQEIKFDSDMQVFRIIFLRHHATVTVSADAVNE